MEPKRLALEEANAELAAAQEKLAQIKERVMVSRPAVIREELGEGSAQVVGGCARRLQSLSVLCSEVRPHGS